MASVIISTLTPAAGTTLSNVPFGQDTTFSVVASADFPTTSYTYQWKKAAAGGAIGSATNIAGAVNATYFFEPASGDNGFKYYCTVNALSATDEGPADEDGAAAVGNGEGERCLHPGVPEGHD